MNQNNTLVRPYAARMALLAGAGLACLAAASAFAQTASAPAASPAPPAPIPAPIAPSELDAKGNPAPDIVVTGTRIRGQAPIGTHLIAIGQQAIQDTGLQTTADVIRTLPQVSGLGSTEAVTGSAAYGSAQNVTHANGIDLRGLGPIATLVLIDGHRPVPEGSGQQLYDPSSIPAIALERIEVVPDGASAIYGADAVAGVVNIITRKNFEGLELLATGTGADHYRGDQFSGIFGHKWSTGSFMIAANHDWHSRLQAEDRPDIYTSDLTGFGGNNQNVYTNNVCKLGGALKSCPTTSSLGAYTAGTNIFGLVPGGTLSNAVNRQNAFLNSSIVPAIQRTNFVMAFHQDLSAAATVRVEAFYMHRSDDFTQTDSIHNVTIAPANPTYISIPGYAGPESVTYDFSNLVNATDRNGYEVNYQIDGGLDFKLPHQFKLAFDLLWGRNYEWDNQQALNVNAYNTAIAAGTLNLTGVGPANNAATLGSIVGENTIHSVGESTTGALHLDGPLFSIGGGNVSIATGVDIKGDTLEGRKFNNTSGPNTATLAGISANHDKRNTQSVFGELVVPLVGSANAMPGIAKLELNVADRYDHFSDFGGTNNPKFAIRYDPFDGLTLNANYGTSFRAPTLAEKDPSAVAVAFYNNPAFFTGPTGNCPTATCSTIMLGGGNASLTPETAKTWSAGFDFKPKGLPGFHANATFFHISYHNIISNPGSLNPLVETNPAYYSLLVRSVSPATNPADLAYIQSLTTKPYYSAIATLTLAQQQGVTQIISGNQINSGGSRTSGIDFAASYQWDMGHNQFNLGVSGEYLTQYEYALVPGAPYLSLLNTINNPLKFHGRLDAGWTLGGLRATGSVNYVGGYTDNVSPGPTGTIGNAHVGSYLVTDLTIAYKTGNVLKALRDTTFSISVQNLFDVSPPIALNGNYSYDSVAANPLGRELSFSVRKKF